MQQVGTPRRSSLVVGKRRTGQAHDTRHTTSENQALADCGQRRHDTIRFIILIHPVPLTHDVVEQFTHHSQALRARWAFNIQQQTFITLRSLRRIIISLLVHERIQISTLFPAVIYARIGRMLVPGLTVPSSSGVWSLGLSHRGG